MVKVSEQPAYDEVAVHAASKHRDRRLKETVALPEKHACTAHAHLTHEHLT